MAHRGGITNGDIVIEFGGEKLSDSDRAQRMRHIVYFMPKGAKLPVKIIRSGKIIDVTLIK